MKALLFASASLAIGLVLAPLVMVVLPHAVALVVMVAEGMR